MKILHCITGLQRDGAQRMLYRLVTAMERGAFENRVVSLRGEEPFADDFRQAGVPVECLGLTAGVPGPRSLLAMRRLIRSYRPDVLQGWMYHANLALTLAREVSARRTPLFWNIRTGIHDRAGDKKLTTAVIGAGARLSRRTTKVIYCTAVSAEQHHHRGYVDGGRSVVLGNGFDTDALRPSPSARAALRRELGVGEEERVVGIVGRSHPQKDHPTFMRAAAEVARALSSVTFVMIGRGLDDTNPEVTGMLGTLGVRGRVRLLGERTDVPSLLPGFDVYVSSSCNEGFPNVIAEAMACGVPAAATDVGASAEIIGDTGTVVPARDPGRLGAAITALLQEPKSKRGERSAAARERIVATYSIRRVARQYEDLYRAASETRRT